MDLDPWKIVAAHIHRRPNIAWKGTAVSCVLMYTLEVQCSAVQCSAVQCRACQWFLGWLPAPRRPAPTGDKLGRGHHFPTPCIALHSALHCTLHCIALCTALHCTALPSTLHCTVLYSTALKCTALLCTELHCNPQPFTTVDCT